MRIISNKADYFFGQKRNDHENEPVVILTNTEEEELKSPTPFLIEGESVIGFAGEIYPFMSYYSSIKMWCPISRTTIDSMNPTEYVYKKERAHQLWPHIGTRYGSTRNLIDILYEDWPTWSGKAKLFDKYGPIFKITRPKRGITTIERNPLLGPLDFAQVMPAHMAWHALNLWACNKARPNRPIPEMTDEIKVEQHGFHPKFSFRKGTGEGPKRKRKC